jgi:hypothetical protein
MVGLLGFVAVRTLVERGGGQMIVRAAVILAPFGMPPLWIGHTDSSISFPLNLAGFYGVSTAIAIAF